MTNILKRIVNPITCIVFALCVSVGEASADELIRYHSGEIATSGSIIKHYGSHRDVVCYQGSGEPYFMLYNELSSTSYALFLTDMDTIYDFEIYDDTIYFCGEGYAYVAGAAMVGYFDVATLTSPASANVAYLPMPLMKNVTAIDVAYLASRKHVVGIGESIQSEGMMVDLIDELSYWNVNFSVIGGDTITLSDLAIVRDYVVVTSIQKATHSPFLFFPNARLWYIDIPTVPGNSLFPSNVNYKDLPLNYSATGKYLIEPMMDGNTFVTAYKKMFHGNGVNPFVVSYYNGLSYIKSVEMEALPENQVQLGDISYTFDNHCVEVLLYGDYRTSSGMTPGSVIYEIPDPPLPSTLYAHAKYGIYLESLDRGWSFFSLGEGISVGYKPGTLVPYFIKYENGSFAHCLQRINFTGIEVQIEHKGHEEFVESTQIYQLPKPIISYKKLLGVLEECKSITNND